MPNKEAEHKEYPDPYKNKKAKDGADFEVAESSMEVGFTENKPLKNDSGPIALP